MEAVAGNIKAPVLRFSEFYGNWENFQLRDQCELITKGTTPKHFDSSGLVTFVKLEAISDFHVRREKCLSISKAVHEGELKRSILEEGDLLLAIAGATVGKLGLVEEKILPANTNQALAIIRTKGNFQSFLIHQMQSPLMFKYIGRCVAVGAQPNLSLKQVGEYPVCIPLDLREQQKIAEFFTSVDEKIEKLKLKKELLEEYKRGMMQKLFSQEIRFKDEDGKDFPDWEERQLGEVSQIVKGKQLNRSDMDGDGHIPVINGGITPSGFTLKHNAAANSITISEGGNSCGFVAFQTVDFWLGGHCYVLEKESLITKFLFQCLKYNQRLIMSLRVGSGLPNIQKKHLSQFSISHPSSGQEQLKIAEFLTGIDDKITAVANQIDKAAEFKRGLLQKMFV